MYTFVMGCAWNNSRYFLFSASSDFVFDCLLLLFDLPSCIVWWVCLFGLVWFSLFVVSMYTWKNQWNISKAFIKYDKDMNRCTQCAWNLNVIWLFFFIFRLIKKMTVTDSFNDIYFSFVLHWNIMSVVPCYFHF